MKKYLNISLFILIAITALSAAITPSLLVFIFPQESMAFNIVLFFTIYFVSLAVFTPVLFGLFRFLSEKLLPKRKTNEEIAEEYLNKQS